MPTFNGKTLSERTLYFSHQKARAVIQGDWKVVWSKRMPWKLDWELYNLKDDRTESNDLAKQFPERVQKMAADWEDYRVRVGLPEHRN